MRRYFATLLLGAALLPVGLRAGDDKREHDSRYYDPYSRSYHEWNSNEDRAYRQYLDERHEKYRDWNRLSKKDQRRYWKWRHDHSNETAPRGADRDDRRSDRDDRR